MNLFYLALALIVHDPSDTMSARMEVQKVFPVPLSESECRDAAQSRAILEDHGTGTRDEFLICVPAEYIKR